jgi:hypothetical protein
MYWWSTMSRVFGRERCSWEVTKRLSYKLFIVIITHKHRPYPFHSSTRRYEQPRCCSKVSGVANQ